MSFGGKVAYCSQTAWIQNATMVRTVVAVVWEHVLTDFCRERMCYSGSLTMRSGCVGFTYVLITA